MKFLLTIFLCGFSINAFSEMALTDFQISFDALPAAPSCQDEIVEIQTWSMSKEKLPSRDQVSKAVAMLKNLKHPSLDQIKIANRAIRDDFAKNFYHYKEVTQDSCIFVRRNAALTLLKFADSVKATEDDKKLIKQVLLDSIQAPDYKTLANALFGLSILADAFLSKTLQIDNSEHIAFNNYYVTTLKKAEAHLKNFSEFEAVSCKTQIECQERLLGKDKGRTQKIFLDSVKFAEKIFLKMDHFKAKLKY